MALVSILFLYLGVGVLAAIGTMTITQKHFSPAAERRFFALLLLPVAAIYLAFVSYFQNQASLRLETVAIIACAALGLLGTRLPLAIVLGYVLHGGWDLVHEIVTYAGRTDGTTIYLTPVPLAYGVFCAAYDWVIAGYVYLRRQQWTS